MEASLKKVIFTCGGTAGHVNPAIALAQLMREKDPETEFLFVGAERGLEKDLIPKAGYDFRTVHISSFHRSFKPREIRHNLVSVGNLLRAPGEARAILRQFRPDVVIGTGGYASFPMVKAAAKAGIPTAVHESNMVPGLTTEMLEPFADRIMVGFEACREHYRHPEKVIVTGTPVRRDFFHLTKAEAKRRLGVEDGRPLLVSFWGSLGASGMNRQMADFLALEAAKEPFHHIHGAGKDGYPVLLKLLREKGVDLADHPALQVREYIYDMAAVMRAADLVLCRRGHLSPGRGGGAPVHSHRRPAGGGLHGHGRQRRHPGSVPGAAAGRGAGADGALPRLSNGRAGGADGGTAAQPGRHGI